MAASVDSVPELVNRHCGSREATGELGGHGDDVRHGLGEVGAVTDPGRDGTDDGRMAVTGEGGAEAGVEVDVLGAVDVPHVRSGAALDEDRAWWGVLPRRGDAAGQVGRCGDVQLVGPGRARPERRLLPERSAGRAGRGLTGRRGLDECHLVRSSAVTLTDASVRNDRSSSCVGSRRRLHDLDLAAHAEGVVTRAGGRPSRRHRARRRRSW